MAKTAPPAAAPETAAPADIRIRLLAPHDHAGRTYPAGAELTLSAKRAQWLIDLKRAEPVTEGA